MSEIKCNKLEITSLRQCDSIKIRGNIGPCIIEGPARQDSCQACQPGCSYWIWPVTHTQISPVKITGYIDFLFFICECSGVCMLALNVGVWERCLCVCLLCMHILVCMQWHVGVCAGAGYTSSVGEHAGVRASATSGAPNFCRSASVRCRVELRRAHDHPQLLLLEQDHRH